MTDRPFNEARAKRMAKRDDATLVKFVHSGSLSSAAAFYQLKARGKLALLAGSR